ncbi:flavin reductase [Acidisoma cellulosilytica]|uniref:Flavin reductase n=1 Tax=Acidisoma cellulosilyticum TaxID=2802395 RepID=A0A964E398_9PROT|nr:flavin reductase [Acidisoma cellulosilyticum]MCB8880231.1 flavin reductase [Acidisoma cellulosilyticum]
MSKTAPVDSARMFRNALGSFATGVTVITARAADGADVGVTANSFNSVSLDPPMILWSIGKNSSSLAAFMQAENFVVHILATDQEALSGRFAKSGTDKFAGIEVERGQGDVPMLKGCAARFQCRTAFRHEAGDHYIIVGEVSDFDHDDHAPLAFHGGRYGMFVRNDPAVPGQAPAEEALLSELLVRAEDGLIRQIEDELSEAEISLPEFEVLRSVSDSVLNVEELEEMAGPGLDTTILVLVEDLAERGYLDAPKGGPITLTEEGEAALQGVTLDIESIEQAALSTLSPHEVALFRRFLAKIVHSFEDEAEG